MRERTCEHCGKWFNNRNSIYCSRGCFVQSVGNSY